MKPHPPMTQEQIVRESYESRFSPGRGILRLYTHKTSRGEKWWSGDFVDVRGIVSLQIDDGKFTRLDFVWDGQCHTRTWSKTFGRRTLFRLCREFISELQTPHA